MYSKIPTLRTNERTHAQVDGCIYMDPSIPLIIRIKTVRVKMSNGTTSFRGDRLDLNEFSLRWKAVYVNL